MLGGFGPSKASTYTSDYRIILRERLYSPKKCLEERFCELRPNGVLRTSGTFFVLWSTYLFLSQEYAASVTWLVDAA